MSEWKPITTLEELQKLCADLDAVRPKTMTEGEVMRLCSFAWKEGEKLGVQKGRADERAAILQWLGGAVDEYAEGLDGVCLSIERGAHVAKGEGQGHG